MHFPRKLSQPIFVWALIVFTWFAVAARAAEKRAFRMGFTPFVYDQTAEAVADMEKFLGIMMGKGNVSKYSNAKAED